MANKPVLLRDDIAIDSTLYIDRPGFRGLDLRADGELEVRDEDSGERALIVLSPDECVELALQLLAVAALRRPR